MRNYLFLLFITITVIGCDSTSSKKANKDYLTDSTGSPYELVVVCENTLWEDEVGTDIKKAFQENVPMLNQPEPKFRLMHKRMSGFKGIFTRHRNIIIFKVDSTLPQDKRMMYGVNYDQWAKPQVVVSLTTKTPELMETLFDSKKDEILNVFEEAEQVRFEKKLKAYASTTIDTLLRNNFDIEISLPKNYKVRNQIDSSFVWLSYEMPISSQGIVIYSYPYNGEELTTEFLLNKRNEFISNIPGQLPNTHMKNSNAYAPITTEMNSNGIQWTKLAGFWNVKNDFMGGPYRNYTTIDAVRNRVLSIDCYVYSPDSNKGQRNYIKQLNAVIKTIKL